MHAEFCCGNLVESRHLEDKDGDGSLVEACGISGSHGGKQV
jgi:hypothetical protein